MTSIDTELVRITVQTRDRRTDVAVPERVPVATLLPALLAAGGADLADRGAMHAGWVLRRITGGAFDTGLGLVDQGVRDGDVLCLGLADEDWPDLDYDDVVEAIAAGAERRGRRWDGRATRVASIATAVMIYAGALVAVANTGPPRTLVTAGFLFAALLVVAAVVAARAHRDAGVATLLGSVALPYAFLGGAAAGGAIGGSPHAAFYSLGDGPAALAVGCLAMIAFALLAAVGVGRPQPAFVAVLAVGAAGLVNAATELWTSPIRAAGVTLGVTVLLAGLAPGVAARFGGLPRPRVPESTEAGAQRRSPVPRTGPVDSDALFAAVARTDDMLMGLLVGIAVITVATSTVLAIRGGWPGRLLVAAAAGSFAFRARSYAALRHRTAVLVTAGLAGAPLMAIAVFAGTGALLVAAVLGVAGLVISAVGASERAGQQRPPHLGRLGDVLEMVSLAAVVPIVCVVLGLYARLRGLHL